MKKIVLREKLSKKARRTLDNKHRIMWDVNPVTKRTENKKAYNRKKAQTEYYFDLSLFNLKQCLL